MQLNPYGEDAVLLAVRLVNEPPATAADLRSMLLEAGVVVQRGVRSRDLTDVRAMLADWLCVVDAADEEARARRLNALLTRWSSHPRLTNHTGSGWHLHYRDDALTVAGVVAALVSVGTALHLVGRGMGRLSRCAAEDCQRVFADVSRNGRQRYCSVQCGNRDAVRRHRAARRRAG
jgi:predicted RNA-binding Zn ribbon-like protein